MQKILTMNMEYLGNDIIDWKLSKNKLEENLEYLKNIYLNLETASKRTMKYD